MIDIFVPALGRPQQIKPLLDSIAQATFNEHRVFIIASPEDSETIAAAIACGAAPLVVTWTAGKADYAKKINYAYGQTDGEWFFQGATDLVFYEQWDVQALSVAGRGRRGVVGTNDLGNPMVKRGRHSTHSLISRSYIEEYGGTVDGTGVVFSETYDHQYCDNEFVETALRRKQFAFSKRSIVEHLHPHWGKAEDDATYVKAMRRTTADRALFMKRRVRMNQLEAARKHQ
jgi:glycosyltransferase involved in cell wall biosynthesis